MGCATSLSACSHTRLTPLRTILLSTLRQGDTKEAYYIGPEVPLDSPLAGLPLHGPNLWPPAERLPAFRATAEAYYAAASALGRRLVRLLALSLGLPQDHFDAAFNPSTAFLRSLRYSAEVSRPADGVLGAGAHTDYVSAQQQRAACLVCGP